MPQWSEMTTPERVTALGDLIVASPQISYAEIGAALGATRFTVRGFMDKHAADLPEWVGGKEKWTDEAEATLRRLWGEGQSGVSIAAAIGMSKSSVFYKLQELGLRRSPEALLQAAVISGKRGAKATHGLKFGKPVSDVSLLPADVDKTAFQPLPGSTPKTLADTAPLRHDGTSTECHWPVGDGPTLFCGCATDRDAEGEPVSRYCAVHLKRNGKMVPKLVLA